MGDLLGSPRVAPLLFASRGKKKNKSPGTRGDGFPISSFFADGDAESAPAERDAGPIHAGCVRARAGEPGPDWIDPRVDPAEPTGPGCVEEGRERISEKIARHMTGAIIPALMHRIPLELRS